ncbi:unnamed protein product [Sphagnum balticum]
MKDTGSLVVEGDEYFMNFLAGLVFGGAGGHEPKEFWELNLSTAVLVELGDHLIDGLGLGLDTEGVDGNFEFWMGRGVPLGSIAPPKSRSK